MEYFDETCIEEGILLKLEAIDSPNEK